MKCRILVGLWVTISLGFAGCGQSEKTAERPKDIGYVVPKDMPRADGGAPAK